MTTNGVVERYKVQFVGGPLAEVERWTLAVAPALLMGGSINGPDDWRHLQQTYGVTHVLNLETEHSDAGFVDSADLTEIPQPDNGVAKPAEWFHRGIETLRTGLGRVRFRLYVHCQAGGSRTPLMVYALLRGVLELHPGAALAHIQTVKPSFGSHPFHVDYLASAERAMVTL